MKDYVTLPALGRLEGELIPPGDKSISHRSVIFGSLAEGESRFDHFLAAEDCLNTLKAFQAMGVSHRLEGEKLSISGVGLRGLREPRAALELGNSGTSARLLMGILSAQPFSSRLTGDESLLSRPMDRVVVPLRKMGAEISGREDARYLPIEIQGRPLKGIRYEMPVPSAQVKSCLLLAGLYAEGETVVAERFQSRNHTELALRAFGANFRHAPEKLEVAVSKTDKLKSVSTTIPGDISSAAFFIVGALLARGSSVRLREVGLNPTRTGLLEMLSRMGAQISIQNQRGDAEVRGDLSVSDAPLRSLNGLPENLAPLMIDEVPVLALAAALAEGETVIRGVGELRVKESDRIAVMAENLRKIGAAVTELEDGFRITGSGGRLLEGGEVESRGDHRVAMTFAIASLVSRRPVTIRGVRCIETSYPGFFDDLNSLRK